MLHRLRKPRCGICQYYELSPLGRQGWCQHPRMTGDGQYLRLVPERGLGCAHRMPVFWAAAEEGAQSDWGDEAFTAAGATG